jgi:hypothetical protein
MRIDFFPAGVSADFLQKKIKRGTNYFPLKRLRYNREKKRKAGPVLKPTGNRAGPEAGLVIIFYPLYRCCSIIMRLFGRISYIFCPLFPQSPGPVRISYF